MDDSMDAIRVDGLEKDYGGFHLGPVTFSVPEGCIVGFIGENGAGKTSTIKALMGLYLPDHGTMEVLGSDPLEDESSWKEQVGVVLDTCRFPDNLTAVHIGKMMKKVYRTWNQERYERYLKQFAVPDDKRVKELSRGMGMKLTLAVALSHDTRLLILDEPTSGLDPVIRNEILDIFLEFVQEEDHTIFLSTHITSDIEKIADYILFIHQGKILLYENKDRLLYDYGILRCRREQKEFLSREDILRLRETHHGLEALVSSRNTCLPQGAVMDRVSLDELMVFLVGKEAF